MLWVLPVPGSAEVVGARYEGETTRYPHGVLGDEIEYDTLVVTLSDGREMRARWEAILVFEDTEPRLWDLDGDGAPEIVTVESHETEGARLSVWRADDTGLRIVAHTPFIGQRFRWLAPIAAADLDQDGAIEIAYVDRPHLAKTVRIWRWQETEGGARLEEVASAASFSNHRIGWPYIEGGIRHCGDREPELILARGDWSAVMALSLDDGKIRSRELAPYSPRAMARALACR
nr:VCBS repeat-containing protein [Cognatishimia sp. F0-27]